MSLKEMFSPIFLKNSRKLQNLKCPTFLSVRLKTREKPRAPTPHFFWKVRKSCSFVFLFSDSKISTPNGSRVISFLLGSDFLYLLVGLTLIQTRGTFMLSLSLCDIITVSVFKSRNVSSFLLSITRPTAGEKCEGPLARTEASSIRLHCLVSHKQFFFPESHLKTYCNVNSVFPFPTEMVVFLYFKIGCHIHIHIYKHIFRYLGYQILKLDATIICTCIVCRYVYTHTQAYFSD